MAADRVAVPKKQTWNMGSINEALHHSKAYHYDTGDVPFSFSKFVDDRSAKIRSLNKAYENNWNKDGIDLIKARATFVSDHELEIKPNDGSDSYRLKADHICIATGSYATKPKGIPGSEHGITSDEFFSIKVGFCYLQRRTGLTSCLGTAQVYGVCRCWVHFS
jgi:glutathione reductase (NADPH)